MKLGTPEKISKVLRGFGPEVTLQERRLLRKRAKLIATASTSISMFICFDIAVLLFQVTGRDDLEFATPTAKIIVGVAVALWLAQQCTFAAMVFARRIKPGEVGDLAKPAAGAAGGGGGGAKHGSGPGQELLGRGAGGKRSTQVKKHAVLPAEVLRA